MIDMKKEEDWSKVKVEGYLKAEFDGEVRRKRELQRKSRKRNRKYAVDWDKMFDKKG